MLLAEERAAKERRVSNEHRAELDSKGDGSEASGQKTELGVSLLQRSTLPPY